MAEQGLTEALNDCIERMAAGQSLNDCLRRYPQYAARLRPLLEVGRLIEHAQAQPFEVEVAQRRVRATITERLQAPPPSRAYGRLVLIAASLLIAFVSMFAAAENSLPGDSLYIIKRFGETARTGVMGMEFGSRRVEEIRVLQALQRPARVDFNGVVEQMDSSRWTVAGLTLSVTAETPGADDVGIGDRIHVDAQTTEQGIIEVTRIQILQKGEALVTPSPEVPTMMATAAPSAIPTDAPTRIQPASATPTPTPTQTNPPTNPLTPTQTHSPTNTPVPSLTPTPTACAPTPPPGWVRYFAAAGDSLGGLATLTGASEQQIMAVNCLPASGLILVGQSLYLPRLPVVTSAPAPTRISQPNVQPTDDNSGNDGGGDDHGGSNSGSGSSGDDGGDDHGGHGSD